MNLCGTRTYYAGHFTARWRSRLKATAGAWYMDQDRGLRWSFPRDWNGFPFVPVLETSHAKPSYFRSIRFSISARINKRRTLAAHLRFGYCVRLSFKINTFHSTMILSFFVLRVKRFSDNFSAATSKPFDAVIARARNKVEFLYFSPRRHRLPLLTIYFIWRLYRL